MTSLNMTKCEVCGKLFTPYPGKTLCESCARNRMSRPERIREAVEKDGLDSPEEIALAVGIPVDDVRAILSRLELPQRAIQPESMCARCKRHEALQGSQYCEECRVQLDMLFREAARTLEEKIAAERKEPGKARKPRGQSSGIRETLEQKRLRTTDQGPNRYSR